MKLTDKEGLEIASTVKDVLEGKVKKETYGKKKKVDEVEEPRPEGEKKFKKKHVVKKSGEKEDGTVMKEEKPEADDKAESRHKADDDTVAMIKANPKMKDKVLKSLNPRARKAVLKALGEETSAKPVAADKSEASAKQEKYRKVFNAALKKFGVSSPAELEGDKKKEFFDYVDSKYDAGDNESD